MVFGHGPAIKPLAAQTQEKNGPGTVEMRLGPTRPLTVKAGGIRPRIRQVPSFCEMPWMHDGKTFMSEVRQMEYLPQAASPEIREGDSPVPDRFSLEHKPDIKFGHEDWFFPIIRMCESLRPGVAGAPSSPNQAGTLKLLLSKVDDGLGHGIRGTALVSQAEVSGPAAF